MGSTSIEWTATPRPDGTMVPGFTFNPWSGCAHAIYTDENGKKHAHIGCLRCYAEVNYSVKMRGVKWGPKGTRVRLSDAGWREPEKWNRQAEKAGERRRVFTASLGDIFEDWQGAIADARGNVLHHDGKPRGDRMGPDLKMDDLRRDLFALIDRTPWLDWLLLTKRPENVLRMWPPVHALAPIFPGMPGPLGEPQPCLIPGGGRSNVWIGTSVSDQPTADKYVPELLKLRCLSPVLFLSVEPILGPVDLCHIDTGRTWPGKAETAKLNCLRGFTSSRRERFILNGVVEERGNTPFVDTEEGRLDWVIVGGESGPKARGCDVAWIASVVQQCKAAGVPVFVKQLGSVPFDSREAGRDSDEPHPGGAAADPDCRLNLIDKKGGDMEEFPEALQVRQFPAVEVPR